MLVRGQDHEELLEPCGHGVQASGKPPGGSAGNGGGVGGVGGGGVVGGCGGGGGSSGNKIDGLILL